MDGGKDDVIKISLLGDVMPGRLLSSKVEIEEEVLTNIRDSSVRLCNFEGVITSSNSPTLGELRRNPKQYLCKHGITPEDGMVMKTLSINYCNLANNHILDYGTESVKETIKFMNANDIKWFGFGKNYETAWKPRIAKVKFQNNRRTRKIAIFGMADHFVEWKADETNAGINFFDVTASGKDDANPNREQWCRMEFIRKQIDKVRKDVDLVIFSIHWGDNFQDHVPPTFTWFAHALIEFGIDIIHGHSTHHVHEVEVYNGKIILYGCGDFLHDYDLYEESLQKKNETLGTLYEEYRSDLGFVYKVFIKDHHNDDCTSSLIIEKLEMLPIQICKGTVKRCTKDDADGLFRKISRCCKELILKDDGIFVMPVT